MNEYLDFCFIPKNSGGKNRWVLCNDTPIPFCYNEIIGTMYATYIRESGKIKIHYNGKDYFVEKGNLLRGKIGGIIHDTSHSYNVGEIKNGGIIKERIFIGKRKGYLMACLFTGLEYQVKEFHLKDGNFNPYIKGKKVWWGNWLYNEKRILKYLKNMEDAKKYSKKSHKKILCRCPKCHSEKYIIIKNLTVQGFGCEKCSRRRSFPERVVGSVLTLNNIDYINEYIFDDLKHRRFDFYLPSLNTVIEAHGLQHYEKIDFFKYDVIEGDKNKREYCKVNNIDLIVIDCRKSNLNFILSQIEKHDFFKDLNLDYTQIEKEMEK